MQGTHRIDPDFAREVLKEVYAYRKLRLSLARLLWLSLGLVGGHRFYLRRPWTGLVMLFSFGGGFVWWVTDGLLLRRMVQEHNDMQDRRRAVGLPPLELAFMPALTEDVLRAPPAWTYTWRLRSATRRRLRVLGDLIVLLAAGMGLGLLADTDGAEEALIAILAVIGVTAAGGAAARLEQFPGLRALGRWSHRLRLFYYFNEPSSPLGLLLRPLIGVLRAPFRPRDRAEVRLYLQLGFASTLFFLLFDIIPRLILPLVRDGIAAAPGAIFNLLVLQAAVTFLVTYMFAAPIGAVLTLYMLTRRTHVVPRLLSGFTLAAILAGVLLAR